MRWLVRSWSSIRLLLKIHRFEVASVIVATLLVAVAAVVVRMQLIGVGVSQECLENWIAAAGSGGPCGEKVREWAAINQSNASKVMLTAGLLPFVAGLVLGVPLVARELETQTAGLSWALSGSRSRWLAGRLVPFAALLFIFVGLAAVAAAMLEDVRTANGVWSSSFSDAALFGTPVVARGLAGLGIGVLAGATIGRALPALIVGAVAALLVAGAAAAVQGGFASATYASDGSLGGPNSVSSFVRANPDIEIRLATPDGALVSLEVALDAVPPETAEPLEWLGQRYVLVPLGVAERKTDEWQRIETVTFLLLTGGLVALSFVVVNGRRPT